MATTTIDAPSVDSLTEQGVNFFRFHLVKNGVDPSSATKAVAKGSDRYLLVRYVAQSLGLVLANERALQDAQMPDAATGDDLVRLAAVYKVFPSPGAGASGPVVVTATGTVTFPAGTECVGKSNRKRYAVVATQTVVSGQTVDVAGVDVGTSTNLPAGESLQWTFPPAGGATSATVGTGGLANGLDPDTNPTLRRRLLDRLARLQNGGSWAHVRAWALTRGDNTKTGAEDAWVYPALQGPSTEHVAVTIPGTADNRYHRTASDALVAVVNDSILAQSPDLIDLTTTTVVEQPLAAVFRITAPGAVSEGGRGGGWLDPATTRWPRPPYLAAVCAIQTVVSSTQFRIEGASTAPTVGATVQFWDSTSQVVRQAVLTVAGAYDAGAYPITVDTPLPTLVAGDYVWPALVQGQAYASSFQAAIATLAPGEKTADTAVLRRGYRHPGSADGSPSALTTKQLVTLQTAHPELANVQYALVDGVPASLPYEPLVPSSPSELPFIFRVARVAFYPQ